MQTIMAVLGFPNGTPVDSIEGRITTVYDQKKINGQGGPTTVQTAVLEDMGGNKIRVSVFGHSDLSPNKGFDVVIFSGRDGKGVKVKHGSYVNKAGVEMKTVELEVGRSGQFQKVEVWKAMNNPQGGPQAGQGVSSPQSDVKTPGNGLETPQKAPPAQVVRGDKVGMAIKASVDLVVHGVVKIEEDGLEATLHSVAAMLIKVSNELEQGK